MSEGVVFYNHGEACLLRLMIAVRSLRHHYAGNLTVFLNTADTHDAYVRSDLTRAGADVRYFDAPQCHRRRDKATYKMRAAKVTPYDTTLFFDSDVLFQGTPEAVFDICKDTGLGVTQCGEGRMQISDVAEQRDPEKKVPAEIRAGTNSGIPRINHGLFLIAKEHPFFAAWPKFYDEFAWFDGDEESITQYHLPLYPHTFVDRAYNRAAHLSRPREIQSAVVVHYLRNRHATLSPRNPGHADACRLWLDAFTDLRLNAQPEGLDFYYRMDPRIQLINAFPETKP